MYNTQRVETKMLLNYKFLDNSQTFDGTLGYLPKMIVVS
jgi:hypothetical protein